MTTFRSNKKLNSGSNWSKLEFKNSLYVRRKNCSRKCKFEESEERTMNLTKKSGDYLIPNIIPNPEPEEVCA